MTKLETHEYVCTRCAALGQTCCSLGEAAACPDAGAAPAHDGPGSATPAPGGQGVPEPAAECFPISPAEQQRIEQALAALPTGLKLQHPFELHDNTPEFLDAMLGLFSGKRAKLTKIYPAGQQHLRMKLAPGGKCLLLGERGCILPQDARPWFCRIFPFWVQRGSLRCFTPEDCLAVRESSSMEQLLAAFAQKKANVLELYGNLKRDWLGG